MSTPVSIYLRININMFFKIIYELLDQDDSNDESGGIFNVLRNMRLYLDQILQMNQVDDVSNQEEDIDDKETYDKIESHLIGCVSVVCHGLKNNQDSKIKNVTIINTNYYIIINIYISK